MPPPLKGHGRKRRRQEQPGIVESLDMDVAALQSPQIDEFDEEAQIVHNVRRSKRSIDLTVVQPSDAYQRETTGRRAADVDPDEALLAIETSKRMKKTLHESDFDIAQVQPEVGAAVARGRVQQSHGVTSTKELVERVERDFASLSNEERVKMITSQSPELVKLLEEFKRYLADVAQLSPRLHILKQRRKQPSSSGGENDIISFLETKVQLLLSYCIHINYYVLLKCEGGKVEGHPVISRLLELRTYLDKLSAVETRLQDGINRLLTKVSSGGGSGAAAVRPRISQLRPVATHEDETYKPKRTAAGVEAAERRKFQREEHLAQELEKEETEALHRFQRSSWQRPPQTLATKPPNEEFREEEDHFFASIASDGRARGPQTASDTKPLIEQLREEQQQRASLLKGKSSKNISITPADGHDESGEDQGDDEVQYEQLLKEERKRANAAAATVPEDRDGGTPKPAATAAGVRRQVTQEIEKHRGLTRARRKDRKNPRTNQRHKYARGQRVAQAQSRAGAAKRAAGSFEGVSSVKPQVTHSTAL